MLRLRARLLAAAILPLSAAILAAQGGHYHVVKTINVGAGGADYIIIDPTNRRLYGLADKVIDVDKDTVIGSIAGGGGGYIIAVPENRGLVRNGWMFDLKTLAITGRIDSMSADGTRYDPFTHQGFGWGRGTQSWIIDMKTGKLVSRASVGSGLETGVADGKGKMYFAVEAAGSVEEFDTQTLKILNTWPVANCGTAQGLTMDTQTRRLFLACDNAEIVVNADNGNVVARIPVSTRSDMNCWDQTTKTLFNPSRSDSTLSVIHEDTPDKYTSEKVPMGGGARTCAVDEVTHKVYAFYTTGTRPNTQLMVAVLSNK
jgi:hypothetical protein